MSPANFRHIGGVVIADHGRLTLAMARALALFYSRQAGLETCGSASECLRRARALEAAVAAALIWRRAAGWNDPELADLRHHRTNRCGRLGLYRGEP